MKIGISAIAGAVLVVTAADAQTAPPPLLPGYNQVFYYDFPGTTLDSGIWPVLYGGTSSNGFFQWSHDDVTQNNGLTITFQQEGGSWTTGGIDMGTVGFTYGMAEFEAKIGQGHGLGPVLLLWPCNNSWPPEIDILEAPNGSNQAFQTLHWGDAAQNFQLSTPTSVDVTQWHDYAADWEPSGVTFYIDGQVTATIPSSSGNDPNQCMTPGISGYIANPGDTWYGGSPNASTPAVVAFQVAWIRVSQPSSDGTSPLAAMASSPGAPTAFGAALSPSQQAGSDAGIAAPVAAAPTDPSASDMQGAAAQVANDLTQTPASSGTSGSALGASQVTPDQVQAAGQAATAASAAAADPTASPAAAVAIATNKPIPTAPLVSATSNLPTSPSAAPAAAPLAPAVTTAAPISGTILSGTTADPSIQTADPAADQSPDGGQTSDSAMQENGHHGHHRHMDRWQDDSNSGSDQ